MEKPRRQVRTLTPQEMQNLPRCKYAQFGVCEIENPEPKYCLSCMLEGIFHHLSQEDLAASTEALDAVMLILKEMKVI